MTGKYLLVSTSQGRMRQFERQVRRARNYALDELVSKMAANVFTVLWVVQWGFAFYLPFNRNFIDFSGSKGTTGEFSPWRKLIAQSIYLLFLLNSSSGSDEIVVLADVSQGGTSRKGNISNGD